MVTQEALIPPAASCDNACEALSARKLTGDSVPSNFSGNGSCRHLCLGLIKIPPLQRVRRCHAQPWFIQVVQALHITHSSNGMMWTLPKFTFPDASQGPSLKADFSNHRSFSPARTLFCKLTSRLSSGFWVNDRWIPEAVWGKEPLSNGSVSFRHSSGLENCSASSAFL